jgi:CRISPR system Cascade subunit CasD
MQTLIRLNGPLQAWGNTHSPRSKPTLDFPTKAGILGIIASAYGIARGSKEEQGFLKRAKNWKMNTFFGFKKTKNGEEVKQRPRVILDFQTIGSPIDYRVEKNESGRLPGATTKESKGIPRTKAYLADADFVVSIETSDADGQSLKEVLLSPHWPLFLGRKCCVPSSPFFICQGDKIPDEITHGLDKIYLNTGTKMEEVDINNGDKTETMEIADVPTTFSPFNKAYGVRFLKVTENQ